MKTTLSTDDVFNNDCFRAIANCTYDWESWHTSAGRLLWVNAAVERMTGYSPEECLEMPDYPLPLVAPEDQEKITQVLQRAQADEIGNDVEFRVLHRDGHELWMAVSWQPMFHGNGKHLGFRTSIRDITERNQLREQLRLHAAHLEQLVQERTAQITQLEKNRRKMEKLAALGQLAAGVAHEVNNPLAGIRNAFALFKADVPADHEHFELLELIDREIERISSITHLMYQLYRPTAQRSTSFSIGNTVEDVIRLLEPAARKAQVHVEREAAETDIQVTLPEGEVKQILLNLIQNAIQASAAGDTVSLQLSLHGETVKVQVVDQGSGIAEEHLPRIFDPFFSTKTGMPRQGMGLGLYVSRSLIEALGGSIDVVSSPGSGTRFTASFPRSIQAS